MTRYYNEEGYSDESGCKGSVRDYFKSQSHGMFVPTFDVVGIVTLDKSYKDYGENAVDDDGNSLGDKGVDYLPGDVVSAAISQLGTDFSQYVIPAGDENHLTGVPLLAMFYAGMGEATEEETTGGDYMWPCEWDDVDDPVGKGTYNEIHFNSFFIGNELSTGGSSLMGPGVFCHEFSHALGLPDFYCTDYSYSIDSAFGHWSIMDCGCYVNNAWAPVGYTAYEKSVMGWLDLKEVGDAEEITLQSPLGSSENSAYIIRNSDTETFIFENRQPDTWYPSDFGSGVMVTRIAYNYNDWRTNVLNNTQSKKRACILTADGAKLYFSASPSNLYGKEKTSIPTLKTYSGATQAVNIKSITMNDDGTITLAIGETSGGGPVVPVEGKLFYESFDQCCGTGANDGNWASTVASQEKNFIPDNSGWEAAVCYGAYECARFGSGSKNGAATTPAFAVTDGAELTFNAAAWGADGTKLTLSTDDPSVTITPNVFEMKGSEWTTFKATVSGAGTIRLTFTPAKRFFLDEVLVVAGGSSAPTNLKGDVNGDGKVDVEDVVTVVNIILEN
jgi:M6 family metalloprotease-like protein